MKKASPAAPAHHATGLLANPTLWACSALHLVNDAFFAIIFPLLPLLAADLDLSYAEVGLIKTSFSAASSLLQAPVGMLAELGGEYALLVGGNAWVAAGLIGMGLAGSYLPLLGLAILAGLGGNTQHPLAASLVSRSVAPERRATAVGTLNFAGDIGKMAAPPLVALVALPYGWRTALIGLGIFGLLFSAVIWRLPLRAGHGGAPRPGQEPPAPVQLAPLDRDAMTRPRTSRRPSLTARWGIDRPWQFTALASLGMIDSSTRGAALAFLPFVLADKGLDPAQLSWLFTLVFVGGAIGKFGCGRLGDRFGARALILVTEIVTVAALGVFPIAPLALVPILALTFGFVLNGTSSVLYAGVADLVTEQRRSRGYGLYYTLVTSTSALAPVLYGMLGDRAGLPTVFLSMAAINALTLPLAFVVGTRREV